MNTDTNTMNLDLEPIDRVRPEIENVVGFAESLTVESAEDAVEATEVLSRMATYRKRIKEARMKITRPLDAAKKAAMDQEKAVLGPLDVVDKALRKRLGEYHAEAERQRRAEAERQEQARRDAEAKAKAEVEAAAKRAAESDADDADDDALDRAALAQQQAAIAQRNAEAKEAVSTGPIRSSAGTASVRMVWDVEVVDPAAVPREFLAVNLPAIRQAVKDGAREIPGVKIERVPQASVRAK